MRRISVHRPKAKVRNPGRRLRALRRWAESFAGHFPVQQSAQPYVNWKIPVLDRLVRPPTTTPAIQAQCIQCLIDAATHLARARPVDLAHARVVAVIDLPDLFGSEVCVFFDERYWQSFTDRTGQWQRWLPLPKSRNLVQDMGLRLPELFVVTGYAEVVRDEETGEARDGEVWLVGECGPCRVPEAVQQPPTR